MPGHFKEKNETYEGIYMDKTVPRTFKGQMRGYT